MFDWLKRPPKEPPIPPITASPGRRRDPASKAVPEPAVLPQRKGEVKVSYANGQRKWEEKFNLFEVLERAMVEHGCDVIRQDNRLRDGEYGFVFEPKVEGFKPLDEGGAQTVTIIRTTHPTLMPQGVFEYQHSTGPSAEESIYKWFEQWMQTDYPVFVASLEEEPKKLTTMMLELPAADGRPARVRRAVLGPVMHLQEQKPASNGDEEHPFCPCCLLTRSLQAFENQMKDDRTYAFRLFAMRDEHGAAGADCRINGEEYEEGKAALRKYVETWPQAGFEFRKQYVIVHSMSKRD